MRRPALLALALSVALAAPALALAHEGDPNYESLVTAVDGAPGVRAAILGGDDRLLLVNAGDATVVVEGYDGEPYARLRPDGTAEVNDASPARYLNDDRFGKVEVPASARTGAAPRWRVVGRGGRLEFHDHRAHWMAAGTPPQVRDEDERTKVTDWAVPLRVDGRPGAVRGTLWWRGTGGDAPVAAFAGLGALALAGAVLVVVVRRRRRRGRAPGAAPDADPAPGREADLDREVW